MNLNIDKQSAEPIYLQISQQIQELVRQGLLAPGSRIPSIRQLARKLALSNSTVATAYDDLSANRIIETRRGSGTYISIGVERQVVDLRRVPAAMPRRSIQPMSWERYGFDTDFFGMPVSPDTSQMLRFTQASPDPALFPLERIKQVSASMLWSPKSFFFELGNPQGYQPLVEHIEREMALFGISMAPGENEIIITAGFQRALALLTNYLVRPGDRIAIESPCFHSVLNLMIAKRLNYVPIPVDEEGMDTDYLSGVLARGEVQAIITIPTFHNPTGISMSLPRREHLLRLAEQYRIPIIEDDWGRMLRYDGQEDKPLKAIDTGGHVIHVGTYSKCLLPGLRLGWITCPAGAAHDLLYTKMGADRSDSIFLQALLYNFIEGGHFHRHVRRTVKLYRRRRDAMCETLLSHLPPGCTFRRPQGGFSVWVELPQHIRSLPLLQLSRERGVDFTPAAFMTPDRHDTNALRLSFSRVNEEQIRRGTAILCETIGDAINKPELLSNGFQSFEDLFQ